MDSLYLLLRTGFSMLLLCLAFSGCQRASYVFQPGCSSEITPVVKESLSLGAVSAMGFVDNAAPVPAFPRECRKRSFTKKRAICMRAAVGAKPAVKLVTSPRSAVLQPTKAPQRAVAHRKEPNMPERYRSRGMALLLALVPLFYGILGLHRFYLGYAGHGLAYLLGGVLAAFLFLLGALGILFGSGGFATLLVVGAVIAVVLYGLQVSDIINIINGNLKPKNGEYNPRFFQTRHKAEPSPETK